MKTKTFKIGEYCKGGVITARVKGNLVTFTGADQSKAIDATEGNAYSKAEDFLCDLTSYYYSEQVIKWVETIVRLNRTPW